MAGTDDWLYNDDLDQEVVEEEHLRIDSETRVLDGEDLLDDMLTAPSSSTVHRTHTPTNEDELLGVNMSEDGLESQGRCKINFTVDSGSARYNAERKAKTVQARIEANRTSQGVATPSRGLAIFSREPNRKNSIYVGNLTWWTTDLDVFGAVKEVGLGEVSCVKFFENRANGQSKGYCLLELESEVIASSAATKLQQTEIHDRKLIVIHARNISPHQFESKCNITKDPVATLPYSSPSFPSSSSSSSLAASSITSSAHMMRVPLRVPSSMPNPVLPQIPRPPINLHMPGFPTPPLPFRPPALPDLSSLGLPPILPPVPPLPTAFSLNPFTRRMGNLPTLPPFPPVALAALGGSNLSKVPSGAPHLNPAFLQDMAQGGNMAEMFAQAAARFRNQAAAFSNMGGGGRGRGGGGGKPLPPPRPSDEDISETNQRNKAISSSAITRAMADAQSGDYESAIDTLKMAITLIKQSITATSEASQIMIQSLQDCLQGMEQQASLGKRYRNTREHHRGLAAMEERARSVTYKPKHHRDRSRERRR